MHWDDFKLVLAIAREQGLPGAAARLGVSLSTVFRRLQNIEIEIGDKLFLKRQNLYYPTDIGADFILTAERMEQEALSAERKLTGRDQLLTGVLKVSASEILSPFFLARHIPKFRQLHPRLDIEIISGERRLNLADREAEIAIWPSRPSDTALVGRQISDIRWAVYVGEKRSTKFKGPVDLAHFSGQEFVGLAGSSGADHIMQIQQELLPGTTVQCRSNSLITAANLTANNGPMALLPCLLGEGWPGLDRISEPLEHPIGELWIICHNDLHRNARVRALFDFLIAAAKSERQNFLGEIV